MDDQRPLPGLAEAVTGGWVFAIFLLALLAVYRWKAKAAVVGIMAGAGALGWLVLRGSRRTTRDEKSPRGFQKDPRGPVGGAELVSAAYCR